MPAAGPFTCRCRRHISHGNAVFHLPKADFTLRSNISLFSLSGVEPDKLKFEKYPRRAKPTGKGRIYAIFRSFFLLIAAHGAACAAGTPGAARTAAGAAARGALFFILYQRPYRQPEDQRHGKDRRNRYNICRYPLEHKIRSFQISVCRAVGASDQ